MRVDDTDSKDRTRMAQGKSGDSPDLRVLDALVIGLGEVGAPLERVLSKHLSVVGRDIEPVAMDPPHVVHLCFPYSEASFIEAATAYIAEYSPTLVVLHSTVPPGTTRKLEEAANVPAVYSPVRGKHARMEADLLRYTKFVAGTDDEAVKRGREHLERAGFRVRLMASPEALELAKVLETSYFGMLIAWAQEMDRFAGAVDADYDEVMTFMEEIDFFPPVTFRPGHIGGHCVMPNLSLLEAVRSSPFVEALRASNEAKVQELADAPEKLAAHLSPTRREITRKVDPESEAIVRFADVRSPSPDQDERILAEIREIGSTGRFILAGQVERFETQFGAYCGTSYAIGVGNGTDALTLGLRANGIGPGDEVIIPANSFIATAEGVVNAGATPVFVDVHPKTYTIDPEKLEEGISPMTRAVLPVHLYGNPADMDEITAIAGTRGLLVMEDAAQAHGGRYKGRRIGSLGALASFSFYPSKNLGAWGDAGAITTNDAEIAGALRQLRSHGEAAKYEHTLVGFNSRLDSIQAAVLAIKLQYLEEWNERRRELASNYRQLLSGIDQVSLPDSRPDVEHVYHLYVIQVPAEERDALRSHLGERGVETGIHYPRPIHLTPAFSYLGYERGSFPVSEEIAKRIISLPMHVALTEAEQERVAQAIQKFPGW